jgi:hypothetical protein
METTSLSKLTRLLSFSVLCKDFQASWRVRFMAYASVGKFLAAPQNGGESTMPSSDSTDIIVETTYAGK